MSEPPPRQRPPAAGEPLDAWPAAGAGVAVGAIVAIHATLVDTSDQCAIAETRPRPGARELLERLRALGCRIVLASSAEPDEVEHYVGLLDARGIVESWTTGADVDRTKPHPDLITTAAERLPDATDIVVIGDTASDALAAKRAGFASIGLLSGGFGPQALRDAGCVAVFADAGELSAHLEAALEAARSAPTVSS